MRRLAVLAVVSVAAGLTGCAQTAKVGGFATFGAPVDSASAISLIEAVALAEEGRAEPVKVKATIGKVCQRRGCWMMLTDGTHDVRVRFTASEKCTEGFFVPRNAGGRESYVQGTIKLEEMTEELARHYAEDQGKSKKEIEQIVGPQPEVRLIATGVMISDGATLDPPAS